MIRFLLFLCVAPAIVFIARQVAAQQKPCASTCGLINVYSSKGQKGDKGHRGETGVSRECSLKDPGKPSAHIEAANLREVSYKLHAVIKDWNVGSPLSHLAGGMTYKESKLTVSISGRYCIYSQIYYHNNGRALVRVNNVAVTITTPPIGTSLTGAIYTGGVYILKAGDVITLDPIQYSASGARIYMYSLHTYFGAFLL